MTVRYGRHPVDFDVRYALAIRFFVAHLDEIFLHNVELLEAMRLLRVLYAGNYVVDLCW